VKFSLEEKQNIEKKKFILIKPDVISGQYEDADEEDDADTSRFRDD
jgi:hypothetical protein